MYLFQRIEELMMTYHDARHTIGEFILHEQKNLFQYTINDIANQTYTSKATVTRFAKTLGYDGWKEFMRDYAAELHYQEMHKGDIDANFPFHENDSTQEIMQKMKKVHIDSIQDTAYVLDPEMINLAVSYLLNARHIVIFGLSPNIFLGELFRRKMITIGKQVDKARSGECGIISNTLGPNDCAIMISYSGNNEVSEPMCHVKNLLRHKVPVIGITSGGDNYIRKNLKCVLTMSSRERLYTKIANFATEESLSYIFNVLFSCYFKENYQKNSRYKIQNSKLLEQERIASLKEQEDDK